MNVNERCDEIYKKILDEREYQLKNFGDDFDSKNSPNDWVAYIAKYLGKSVVYPFNKEEYQKALIKVATLCFAALEFSEKEIPKRHYD